MREYSLFACLFVVIRSITNWTLVKTAEDVTSGELLVMYEHKTAAIAQMCAASTQRAKVWADRRECLRQLLDVLEILRTVSMSSLPQLAHKPAIVSMQSVLVLCCDVLVVRNR